MPAPVTTLTPAPATPTTPSPEGWLRAHLPLATLVTDHAVMTAVLDAATPSDTPDEPIWVRVRTNLDGRYEIADGHHRVAAAIKAGHTHVWADIDTVPDDEPYQGPFFDFAAIATVTH